MTPENLKLNLEYLVNKYISDSTLRNKLIEDIEKTDINDLGVKGILHEINSHSIINDSSDSLMIKEIVFHFC